jgi:hypothetical protein
VSLINRTASLADRWCLSLFNNPVCFTAIVVYNTTVGLALASHRDSTAPTANLSLLCRARSYSIERHSSLDSTAAQACQPCCLHYPHYPRYLHYPQYPHYLRYPLCLVFFTVLNIPANFTILFNIVIIATFAILPSLIVPLLSTLSLLSSLSLLSLVSSLP